MVEEMVTSKYSSYISKTATIQSLKSILDLEFVNPEKIFKETI